MKDTELFRVALTLIPQIGPRLARRLVSYTGSIEGIFQENKHKLSKIPGIGEGHLQKFDMKNILSLAESELEFIQKNGISYKFYLDKDYPRRLKECEDAPLIIYYKGKDCFDDPRIISIVGTRKATPYGIQLCENFVRELKELIPDVVIVSGYAYGIDICAHKAAIQNSLKTIAVFGHDLSRVYPVQHAKYIKSVLDNGCTVTEFPSLKKLDQGNFVSRNRIIAGLSDATIVVESALRGGALITADIASSYNRDVFAFPGRVDDIYSNGCNNLIRQNKAALIESAKDFVWALRWEENISGKPVQKQLFPELNDMEQKLYNELRNYRQLSLDELSINTREPVSKLSAILLNLEFKGLVKAMPGKTFSAI